VWNAKCQAMMILRDALQGEGKVWKKWQLK
jgi:hypothetical protein